MKNVSKNVEGLGLRIAQGRTKLNLSQNDISDLIGMSRPNYTAIENEISGRFLKDYQLKNIAIKLQVSSDYLLGLISDPNPNADIMSMVNSLGISSDAIKFIQSLKSNYNPRMLHVLDDFIKSSSSEFLETIYLFKRVKTFFSTEYSLVLEFEKDIENNQIDIYNNSSIDFSTIKSCYKYFYFNLDDAKKYFKIRKKLLHDCNYNFSTLYAMLEKLWKTGEYTENYIYLYQDKSKLENFKYTLEHIRKILYDFVMILDFDETGLIFSTSEKEEEIAKIIDKLILLIDKSSTEPIDELIMSLHSSLSFFSKTITSSLDFIKYKINNQFNNYLEKELKL